MITLKYPIDINARAEMVFNQLVENCEECESEDFPMIPFYPVLQHTGLPDQTVKGIPVNF